MTDRYAVFGNPVAHSLSPQIHKAFAEQTAEDMSYSRQLVEPGQFKAEAEAFFQRGGRGLNITVPFKLDAFAFADQLSRRARQAGAVNTLAYQPDRTILGDNTDGEGLVRDILDNLGWQLAGARVLLIGAGGAARGVVAPIMQQQPRELCIVNRTDSKARQLSRAFSGLGTVSGCGYDALSRSQFDLLINATSASLGGELPPLADTVLAPGARAYDMVYAAQATAFMDWAMSHGAAETADGLGMLVEQAAQSFRLWRNVMPETATVLAAVRRLLRQEPF
jgi:shikimate dehydrogenase